MYLPIGDSVVVPYSRLLGVFDLDNATYAKRTREFLERAEEDGRLVTLGQRLPASLVVTDGAVYLSPVSAQTLNRRLSENRWE